jgi:hypothetical protein
MFFILGEDWCAATTTAKTALPVIVGSAKIVFSPNSRTSASKGWYLCFNFNLDMGHVSMYYSYYNS